MPLAHFLFPVEQRKRFALLLKMGFAQTLLIQCSWLFELRWSAAHFVMPPTHPGLAKVNGLSPTIALSPEV
jgi:hypothetical protein